MPGDLGPITINIFFVWLSLLNFGEEEYKMAVSLWVDTGNRMLELIDTETFEQSQIFLLLHSVCSSVSKRWALCQHPGWFRQYRTVTLHNIEAILRNVFPFQLSFNIDCIGVWNSFLHLLISLLIQAQNLQWIGNEIELIFYYILLVLLYLFLQFILFYYCSGWRHIVAFTNVLTIYQYIAQMSSLLWRGMVLFSVLGTFCLISNTGADTFDSPFLRLVCWAVWQLMLPLPIR
jgi:hypothetical protein